MNAVSEHATLPTEVHPEHQPFKRNRIDIQARKKARATLRPKSNLQVQPFARKEAMGETDLGQGRSPVKPARRPASSL